MRSIGAVMVIVLVAACAPVTVTSPVPASPPSNAPATRPTTRPSQPPTPSASPAAGLPIDELPEVAFDPTTTTTICDPLPIQGLNEPVEVDHELGCMDGLEAGLRAIRTVTSAPVRRMYLSRPPCAVASCVEAASTTATVTAWTDDGELVTTITEAADPWTATPPTSDGVVSWPQLDGTAPAVNRPAVKAAPAEVANREPYPFCGRSDDLEAANPGAFACFVSAVLDGRPAELISIVYGTEGGRIVRLDRYPGSGAVREYLKSDGEWLSADGGLILNPGGSNYSFEQWPGGFVDAGDAIAGTLDLKSTGWGQIWATPPKWWTLPPGAQAVETDDYTLLYVVNASPAAAIAGIERLLADHGLSVIDRDDARGWVSVTFDDGSDACRPSVVAQGTAQGTRVEVHYPVDCPR